MLVLCLFAVLFGFEGLCLGAHWSGENDSGDAMRGGAEMEVGADVSSDASALIAGDDGAQETIDSLSLAAMMGTAEIDGVALAGTTSTSDGESSMVNYFEYVFLSLYLSIIPIFYVSQSHSQN